MTEEQIKQKAEEYATENYEQCIYDDVRGWENDFRARKEAYIAGATENGIKWHDLRKDPNDLPNDDRDVVDERGMIVWCKEGVWYEGDVVMKIRTYPIAWCEIPQFKE